MKTTNIYLIISTIIILGGFTGCSDFLDEENREALDAETIFADPAAFDQLVANVYDKMRPAIGAYDGANNFYDIDFQGTDIFTRPAPVLGTDELNDYVNLNPVNYALLVNWQNYYLLIAAANSAIDRAEEIVDLSEAAKAKGISEVKFMRAYAYFHLVEQFGGVPLIVNEVRGAQTDFSRASEEEIYNQIIQDLDEALANVDENPERYGRVSKDAVRHLKAEVLLTRGYKSFAGSTDFADAATLAETVIGNHALVTDFGTLFSIENQRNSEVFFALVYGSNPVNRGVGNNRHLLFKFTYDVYPGMFRSDLYHRSMGGAPTPFFYSLFEEDDEREDATVRRVMYALEDYRDDDGNLIIAEGDTTIYFPETAWTPVEKAQVPYTVINPSEHFTNNGITQVHFPMFKKFDDPGVAYTNPGIDFEGERDTYIFRSGGTRLIAAEAYLMDGKPGDAVVHINAVRERAGLTTPLDASDVTIDLILNERARELAGETSRWMSLKRTGKLIERVLAYNPHAALNNAISQKHLLRPIPQSEVEVSGGTIAQNEDY